MENEFSNHSAIKLMLVCTFNGGELTITYRKPRVYFTSESDIKKIYLKLNLDEYYHIIDNLTESLKEIEL